MLGLAVSYAGARPPSGDEPGQSGPVDRAAHGYVGRLRSAYPGHLVRLQAELPLRVGEAEGDRPFGVAGAVGTVHRLHREAAEIEPGEVERVEPGLRHDDLQFVARR